MCNVFNHGESTASRGVFMGKIPLVGGIAGNNRVNYLWYMHKEFGII